MSNANPKKWRFTWETQSHSPILKLFLFNPLTNPSLHCTNLHVTTISPQNQLLITYNDATNFAKTVSFNVPIPSVLIDVESPVKFKALTDHIEVKIVLILPVNHPIVSRFRLIDLSDDVEANEVLDVGKVLDVDSDLKRLKEKNGVDFYCRCCEMRLNKAPIRHFVEMPSVNWREAADNWFGNCCCSFGGVSEKLVNSYADSYACAKGVCLLNSNSVTLYNGDLVGFEFSQPDEIEKCDPEREIIGEKTQNGSSEELRCGVMGERCYNDELHCESVASDLPENLEFRHGCCALEHHAKNQDVSESTVIDVKKTTKGMDLLERSLVNGILGNIFMARSYNRSNDIEWKQFFCPKCSSLLGAYPCANKSAHVDDGIRIFKCYVSTSLPIGGSDDLFRKYTLERMFVNELVESAKDELSFRTVVRDLATKTPGLQTVLLNPNTWLCSGNCFETESKEEVSKLDLRPVIKVLFADCKDLDESQSRVLEDWHTKNKADEVFMLNDVIEQLIGILVSSKDAFPPSCSSVQGMSLSCMLR